MNDGSLAIWGLLMQNFTFAVFIPMMLTIHLFTSPTVTSTHVADYLVDIPDILSVLPAMVIGFDVPSVLMSLPAPSVLSFHRKQVFMAIWQFFPLWVSIVQQLVSFLAKSLPREKSKRDEQQRKSIRAMRITYATLLFSAAFNQLSTFVLVAVSHLFPGMLAPEFKTAWNFSNVFVPKAVTAATKMDSIASGTNVLLQYDELIGSVAMQLWALVLFFQTRDIVPRPMHKIRFFVLSVMTLALTGPLGFVVALVWARDEMIFAKASNDKKNQ